MSNVFYRSNQIVSQYNHEVEIMASNSIPFQPKKISEHNARYFPKIASMTEIKAPCTPCGTTPLTGERAQATLRGRPRGRFGSVCSETAALPRRRTRLGATQGVGATLY